MGSSPRMRGTHRDYETNGDKVRIIPAHAGNTVIHARKPLVIRDHPRACGEHSGAIRHSASRPGSSPRMRGTPVPDGRARPSRGIIPAHAGNTGSRISGLQSCGDHPRACGEHAWFRAGDLCDWGSSPRMRGTLSANSLAFDLPGIIPAHAGNTMADVFRLSFAGDHPRACGEHRLSGAMYLSGWGSSPRMRGTLPLSCSIRPLSGIIPAHAGNTL